MKSPKYIPTTQKRIAPAVKVEKHGGVSVPIGKTQPLEEIASKSLETNALGEYTGPDLRFYGRNNLDVAIATLIEDATNGLPSARTELLDRILGKPLQRQDIRSQNVTLVGFLDQVSAIDAESEVVDEVTELS